MSKNNNVKDKSSTAAAKDSSKKKGQPPVMWNGREIFDGPTNAMESEISDYILSQMTTELADRIADQKLTLKGCLENCCKKGKKFEIRNGNQGFAPVTAEQHWKWVCGYFGLDYESAGEASEHEPPKITVSRPLVSDLDSLLDF